MGGRVGFRSKVQNNKQRSLGPEWLLSEVGPSPPYDLDIPHRLVASNMHLHTHIKIPEGMS